MDTILPSGESSRSGIGTLGRTGNSEDGGLAKAAGRTRRSKKRRGAGFMLWSGLIFCMAICLLAELGTAWGIPVPRYLEDAVRQIRTAVPQEVTEQLQSFLYDAAFDWAADSLPVCGYSLAVGAAGETAAGSAETEYAAVLWSAVADSRVIRRLLAVDRAAAENSVSGAMDGNGDGSAMLSGGRNESGADEDEAGSGEGNRRDVESGEGNGGDAENGEGNGGDVENGEGNGGDVENGKGNGGDAENGEGNGGDVENGEGNSGDAENGEENSADGENGEENGGDRENGEENSGGGENEGKSSGEEESGEENDGGGENGEGNGGEGESGDVNSGEGGKGEEDGSGEGGNAGMDTDNGDSDETAAGIFHMPSVTGTLYTARMLTYSFLTSEFYNISTSTVVYESELNGSLLSVPLALTEITEEPQILIYHTHSHEFFVDSDTTDLNTGIVGVGAYLTELLEGYGYSVLQLTDEFDYVDGELDRSKAYTYAAVRLKEVLAMYPSIEVMIDLHRDGVDDDLHLVTEINGKSTAMIMFFNGMSRTTAGNISYLPNENLTANLAFSLQLKVKAEAYYPGFTRKNYIKPYRYNLHLLEKSLLIEAGAQTNTFEEVKNAMEPLAVLLYIQLSGLE